MLTSKDYWYTLRIGFAQTLCIIPTCPGLDLEITSIKNENDEIVQFQIRSPSKRQFTISDVKGIIYISDSFDRCRAYIQSQTSKTTPTVSTTLESLPSSSSVAAALEELSSVPMNHQWIVEQRPMSLKTPMRISSVEMNTNVSLLLVGADILGLRNDKTLEKNVESWQNKVALLPLVANRTSASTSASAPLPLSLPLIRPLTPSLSRPLASTATLSSTHAIGSRSLMVKTKLIKSEFGNLVQFYIAEATSSSSTSGGISVSSSSSSSSKRAHFDSESNLSK